MVDGFNLNITDSPKKGFPFGDATKTIFFRDQQP